MSVKKMAILTVTPEALRALLQLPDGVELVRVEMSQGQRGVLKLMIEGAGWDTPEAGHVQFTNDALITDTFDGEGALVRRSIDWRLPKD
jgi:hypothetical protein